jgi:O-antigen ligase
MLAGASRAELFLAGLGLFLCTGLPGSLLSVETFRWAKHGFYAVLMLLLVVRWQSSLRVAARDWALCVLLALLLVSTLWSDLPVWALKRGAVILQTSALGLYLASRFSVEQQVRTLAWVFLLTLGICAVSMPLDVAWMIPGPGQGEAFRGPLYHKNAIGRLMSLAIPVLLIQTQLSSRERRMWWLAVVAAAVMLVLSHALSGLLVAGMLCSVVLLHPLARRRGRTVLLLPVLVVALGALAATEGWLDPLLAALGKDPTLTGRTQIWELTLRQIAERPLLGYSIASFWQLSSVAKIGAWFPNAHNGYLQLLVELGAVGFLIFAVQLITTLVRSLVLAQRRGGTALWPYCVAAYVFVYNLAEVSLMEENSIVWVAYVSASLAVRSRGRRSTPVAREQLRGSRRDPVSTGAPKPGPAV